MKVQRWVRKHCAPTTCGCSAPQLLPRRQSSLFVRPARLRLLHATAQTSDAAVKEKRQLRRRQLHTLRRRHLRAPLRPLLLLLLFKHPPLVIADGAAEEMAQRLRRQRLVPRGICTIAAHACTAGASAAESGGAPDVALLKIWAFSDLTSE